MYRRNAAYLFALALALAALILCGRLAQPNAWCAESAQATGNQPSNSQTASLEGTLVNAQTGEPVRKAEVSIFWQPKVNSDNRDPIVVSTDSAGRFSVTGIEPGQYRVRAEANLFVPQGYGTPRPGGWGKPLTLASGQTSELTLRLQPCAVITGTVHDEDGDPVLEATVQAIPVGRSLGFRGGRQEHTNDAGQYRLYNLMPGQYLVLASFPGRRERSANPQQTYVPMFYPGTANVEEAIHVSAQPGSEVPGIDVDLKSVHAVRVRGRLVNQATGQPAKDGYVMLLPRNFDAHTRGGAVRLMAASQNAAGVRDSEGDFEIEGVPAGSYWALGGVQVNDRRYQGRVPVEVGDTDVQGVEVSVTAGLTLTGRVRVEPPQTFDFTKLIININPLDTFMGGQAGQAKSDGTFALEDVLTGNYGLSVSGFPERYYAGSARLGGSDVLQTGMAVEAGGATSLDIVLSSSGGSISGAVLKDHQPARASILLVPDAPRRDRQDLYSSKLTKPDGTFTMVGLPPGDFKLFAFEDPDPDLQSDSSLLQSYETKGQSVHIEEGKSQSVQLELIQADGEP